MIRLRYLKQATRIVCLYSGLAELWWSYSNFLSSACWCHISIVVSGALILFLSSYFNCVMVSFDTISDVIFLLFCSELQIISEVTFHGASKPFIGYLVTFLLSYQGFIAIISEPMSHWIVIWLASKSIKRFIVLPSSNIITNASVDNMIIALSRQFDLFPKIWKDTDIYHCLVPQIAASPWNERLECDVGSWGARLFHLNLNSNEIWEWQIAYQSSDTFRWFDDWKTQTNTK